MSAPPCQALQKPRYFAAKDTCMAPQDGTVAVSSDRNSTRSIGKRGAITVLPILSNKPEIKPNSRNIDAIHGKTSKPLGITIAMSSAQARAVLSRTLRLRRRRISSDATANSKGESGQPCLIPRVMQKPKKATGLYYHSCCLDKEFE